MTNSYDDIQIQVSKFEVIPEGIYPVVISSLEKVEGPTYNDPNKMEIKIKVEFTIVGGEEDGHKIYQRVRPKLGMGQKTSNLLKLWDAVDSRTHNYDEFDKFTLGMLAGKQLQIVVKEVAKDGKTFSNVTDYLRGKSAKSETTEELKPESTEEVDPVDLLLKKDDE